MKTKMQMILQAIAGELHTTLEELDDQELEAIKNAICKADKIFVAGAGRSLMMIRGFAMRLMHIGYIAYVVGETVTPAIAPGDLLIIASGSGGTDTLVSIARKCKEIGADLALITTNPVSAIGELANVIVQVKTISTKVNGSSYRSVQPGSSTFEEAVLLIGDGLIANLVADKDVSDVNAVLMSRHANLE